jgi:hypothetical protein
MNKKLILTGIVLLTILSACSERDNEAAEPQIKTKRNLIIKRKLKVSSKIVTDSLKMHKVNDETSSYDAGNEIVDPTKPDKPW